MKQYYNQKGELVIIAEMPDAYLLNSLAKYNARLKEMDDKSQGNAKFMAGYRRELRQLVASLKEEVAKRNIL